MCLSAIYMCSLEKFLFNSSHVFIGLQKLTCYCKALMSGLKESKRTTTKMIGLTVFVFTNFEVLFIYRTLRKKML